jgi:hypothetical protein
MATIGQKEISKDYPIKEERTWETIQDLIPEEADLTNKRFRVGLN